MYTYEMMMIVLYIVNFKKWWKEKQGNPGVVVSLTKNGKSCVKWMKKQNKKGLEVFYNKKLKENMQMQNAKKGQDMLVHNTLATTAQ